MIEKALSAGLGTIRPTASTSRIWRRSSRQAKNALARRPEPVPAASPRISRRTEADRRRRRRRILRYSVGPCRGRGWRKGVMAGGLVVLAGNAAVMAPRSGDARLGCGQDAAAEADGPRECGRPVPRRRRTCARSAGVARNGPGWVCRRDRLKSPGCAPPRKARPRRRSDCSRCWSLRGGCARRCPPIRHTRRFWEPVRRPGPDWPWGSPEGVPPGRGRG